MVTGLVQCSYYDFWQSCNSSVEAEAISYEMERSNAKMPLSTMKAVVFEGPYRVSVQDRPIPTGGWLNPSKFHSHPKLNEEQYKMRGILLLK